MDGEPEDQQRVTSASEWKSSRPSGVSAIEMVQAQAMARQAAALLAQSAVAPVLQAAEGIRNALDRMRPQLTAAFELIARSLPPNWSSIDLKDGVDLASAGWPIVWVPRGSIVEQLVHASSYEERNEVLSEQSDLVLDDVQACLDGMRSIEESNILLAALTEAVAAARAGLWIACQVTTTAVLDTTVGAETDIIGTKLHTNATLDEDEITLVEMRMALILQALPRTFESFYASHGDPVPTTYNRHASVHRLSDLQLTQANALFALLLTTSLLRELHEYGDEPITVGTRVIERRPT